jgi:hypothetical protein
MKAWARRDPDLTSLHDSTEFRNLITNQYWWEVLEVGGQTEAVADQYMRTFIMLREAVRGFGAQDWLEGETNYQRPVSIALHIGQSLGMYAALKPGDSVEDALMQINWESPDASIFPDQDRFLAFLKRVEEKIAFFIKEADLDSEETQFPWTGSSKLSRTLYSLRHAQHHLADMAMELQRRGLKSPDWS